MQNFDWIILGVSADLEAPSLRVVEVAAQRMRGWHSYGPPFIKFIKIPGDEGADYEIKSRKSEPARSVYASLAEYVRDLPLVAYDLDYVLDQVLKPEWARLKIATIGTPGFCALRLTRRLLDPLPAAGCKLMSLHKHYHLPVRLVPLALADVLTVADLMTLVLQPIAVQRGLDSWEKLAEFACEEWYPSQLTFGKYKGRPFRDALEDAEMHDWIERLAASSNEQSACMGRWYLQQIAQEQQQESDTAYATPATHAETVHDRSSTARVVPFTSPDLQRLRERIAMARARLAELEATYTYEKNNVVALEAQMFQRLRPYHEERDRLRVLVSYRQKFINTLLRDGEDEAEHVRSEYQQADASTREEYEETESEMLSKRRLFETEEAEIKVLWRKLVKVFHPDRFAHDPQMQETYTKLTGAINTAKDNGDLETLRQIAEDPNGYILRQGWTAIDLGDSDETEQLLKLINSLEAEIRDVIEALEVLHESSAYKLYKIIEEEPAALDELVELQIQAVQKHVAELHSEAERLKNEISELTDVTAVGE